MTDLIARGDQTMHRREPYPFHRHRYTAEDLRRMAAAAEAWDRAQARKARTERRGKLAAVCLSLFLTVALFYGAAGDVLTLTGGFTA